MNNYKYILEPYNGMKSRYTCPNCGKKNEFVRYIDTETKKYIHSEVGRCNREEKCGYHYKPREYFKNQNIEELDFIKPNRETQSKKPSYIEKELIRKSMSSYETNKFAQFLEQHFPIQDVYNTLKKYYVGTSNHWQGATVFPQIDENGKVRSAKIILYDHETGNRRKDIKPPVKWLHTLLRKKDFNLEQCLFGQHLIPQASTVCIVESEKTAIIAALTMPQHAWVATGGKNGANINPNLFAGKNTTLFPDLNVDWSKKATSIPNAEISQKLEKFATPEDKENGLDLADFILRKASKRDKKNNPMPVREEPNPYQPILNKMTTKNPALNKLIDTFDLQVEGYSQYTKLSKEELAKIALETIGKHNHLSKENIPHFEEMLNQNIIKLAEPLKDKYYLSESTPF